MTDGEFSDNAATRETIGGGRPPLTLGAACSCLLAGIVGATFVAYCAAPAWVRMVWPIPVAFGAAFGGVIVFPVFLWLADNRRPLVWVFFTCIFFPAAVAATVVSVLPHPAAGFSAALSAFVGVVWAWFVFNRG